MQPTTGASASNPAPQASQVRRRRPQCPAATKQRGISTGRTQRAPVTPVSKPAVLVFTARHLSPCNRCPTATLAAARVVDGGSPPSSTDKACNPAPLPLPACPPAASSQRGDSHADFPSSTTIPESVPAAAPLTTAERRTSQHCPAALVHPVQCGTSTGCPQPAPKPVSTTTAMARHTHCPLPCCNFPARRPSPSRNFPAAFTQRGVSIGLTEPTPEPTSTKPAPLTINARGSPSRYPAALSQRGVSAATAATPGLPPTATSSPAMVQKPPPRWPRRGCITRFSKLQAEVSSSPSTPPPVVNPEGLSTPLTAAPTMRSPTSSQDT
ncbi:hypothetical protein JYU34_022951 [Plutella xylostella]|uniref:Uncharacterized protein n=1 Tax=Plutella xylostella TaxID=51655 RepID=A0ABQ7PP05_PLUXY|nr:hypothetical protein JYU34_022951 [Plutella xylostella]